MADTEVSPPPPRAGMIRCEDGSIEVFDTSISDDKIYDDGLHQMSAKEWEDYYKQVRESDGFDVQAFPNVADLGLITPMSVHLSKGRYEYYAKLGITRYNQDKNASLELVDVTNATAQPRILYITFEAKETSTGQIGTYQTMVCTRCPREASYVEFTRPKPEKGLSEIKGREREEEEKEEEKEKEKEKEREAKRLKSEEILPFPLNVQV